MVTVGQVGLALRKVLIAAAFGKAIEKVIGEAASIAVAERSTMNRAENVTELHVAGERFRIVVSKL